MRSMASVLLGVPLFKLYRQFGWPRMLPLNLTLSPSVDAAFSQEVVKRRFFGQEESFPAGFLHVAKLAGCPLVPLLCLGNSRRLRIEFGKALWLENTPDRTSFAHTNLTKVLRILEEQIKSHPAEWDFWIRWSE